MIRVRLRAEPGRCTDEVSRYSRGLSIRGRGIRWRSRRSGSVVRNVLVIANREVMDAGRVLRECLLHEGSAVADELLADVAPQEWQTVQRAAALHRVTPAVFLGLRESRVVPRDVICALQSDYETSLHRHLLCWELLSEVSIRFAEAGIAYVAMKGPILAETVYPRSDLRSYGDLDVLVRPGQFGDALRLLEVTSATLYEANWELMLHTLRGELNLVTRVGVPIDLHWSLLHDADTRAAFPWRSGEVLERAHQEVVAGKVVSVPDPTDQLLHLCAHACLEGGSRLSWLQDIRFAATRLPVDWDALRMRAHEAGLELVVAVMLDRVNRCFGCELPIVSDRASESRPWLQVVRALDRVRPPWRWYGSQLSGRLLVASTRRTSRDSTRALAASVRRELSELIHEPEHPWRRGQSRGPADRQLPEMLREVGGRASRQAFLTAVARVEHT